VYGTGYWSFLIPHIDPDLGLHTICLDICAQAQKCWSQRNPGATILTSWWLREIQTWVLRQFVLILVHEYKVWVTRQYRHSFFDTLIWFPIVHYHTCNVDVKPHVADNITGWNLLSYNCVFDTYSLDDDELTNFTCVSCVDMLILLTFNIIITSM